MPHEISVMTQVIECVLAELSRYEIERVEEVRLEIGKLSFLSKDALRFAFEVLTENTILKGAQLLLEERDAAGDCGNCGFSGRIVYKKFNDSGDKHFLYPDLHCPNCGCSLRLTEGTGCVIKDIKVVVKDV